MPADRPPAILFVCLGNICRSPAAEAVTRAMAEARGLVLDLDSAGTGDWHIGQPPHPPMVAAARTRGYDLTPLRARQIASADFDRFDLILGMDRANLAAIERLRAPGAATPVRLFLGETDVPDPYFDDSFAAALDLIEAGARRLLDQLETQLTSAKDPKFS
jgi:protein-tyrosine phosphatase